MSEMTMKESRNYMGLLYGLGIVKDKRLLIRHFTQDKETMDAVIAEMRKLKKTTVSEGSRRLDNGYNNEAKRNRITDSERSVGNDGALSDAKNQEREATEERELPCIPARSCNYK